MAIVDRFSANAAEVDRELPMIKKSVREELPDAKKTIWLFVVACFIGYVIEMLFCVLVFGKLESRQGVLFGPFTQVYGIGAVVMCFTVIPLSRLFRGQLGPTFAVSALVGGVVEYASSYIEELLFGTRSWDFSDQFLSVHGRTSLLFMIFWGFLGCVFVKWIYPALNRWIDKIKVSKSSVFCGLLVLFFAANFTLSDMAVNRWVARAQGSEAQSSADMFLDAHYPDARMKDIFPKMRVAEK